MYASEYAQINVSMHKLAQLHVTHLIVVTLYCGTSLHLPSMPAEDRYTSSDLNIHGLGYEIKQGFTKSICFSFKQFPEGKKTSNCCQRLHHNTMSDGCEDVLVLHLSMADDFPGCGIMKYKACIEHLLFLIMHWPGNLKYCSECLDHLVKIKIPMTDLPPEVRDTWRDKVHMIPDVTKWLQDPLPGLFIVVFEITIPPDDEAERRRIFLTADVCILMVYLCICSR